jgi:hypothetical protein
VFAAGCGSGKPASTSTFFITLLLPPWYRIFVGFDSEFRRTSDPFGQVELGSDDFLAKLL